MQALLDVILPVFLVIGFGYLAVWRGILNDNAIDGVMRFTQNIAIPALLFRAISQLDLAQSFDFKLLGTYYFGATIAFGLGLLGARALFKRSWEESVAIGFCALFSNSLMLGLPITERAFGADALVSNYAIVALHSPFCYGIGITAMEIARANAAGTGTSTATLIKTIFKAMFRNALIVGIGLGFIVNLSGLMLPTPFTDALDLLVRTALPAALFGVGGILVRYRPEGDLKVIAYVCAVTLIVLPAMVWGLGTAVDLPQAAFRSAVLTAAMAPGINVYIFANMYGLARRVAASSVLIGTILSVLTVWIWLGILP